MVKHINNKEKRKNRYFALQWHLTAKCSNFCSHCYLQNSTSYNSEIKNELSVSECFKIIDDFFEMLKTWDIKGRIAFTGGDPLLKNEIFDLIKYAIDKKIDVEILGNPEFLDRDIAWELKKLGVS